MDTTTFAKINRSSILSALGYQKAPSYMYPQLDMALSGCLSCASHDCSNCSHKVYTNQDEPLLDRHTIGDRETLKSTALKLYILFHYAAEINIMPNTNIGLIKNVSRSYLSRTIGCNKKSIDNNLKKLADHGYIIYCHSGHNLYNIGILQYSDMFLPAQKGGRGYLELGKDILAEIINADNLNSLRGLLQLLDGTLSNQYTGYTRKPQMNIDIAAKCKNFPDYIKPNILMKAYEKFSHMFNFKMPEFKEEGITVALKDEYNPKIEKANMQKEAAFEIDDYFTKLNQSLSPTETPAKNIQMLTSLGIEPAKDLGSMKRFIVSKEDLADLKQMAVQYSVPLVLKACADIYNYFINPALRLDDFPSSLGAYVRQNIRERMRLKIYA